MSLRRKFVDELQKPFHFRVDRGYVFGDNALDEIPNLLKRIAQTPHFFMYAFGSLTMNFHLFCPFDMRHQRNISVLFSLSRAARESGRSSLTIIEDTRLFSCETLLRFEHLFVSTQLGANQSLWPPFRQPTLEQTDQSSRAYGLVQRSFILRCCSISASLTKSFDFDNLTLG